MNKLKQYKGITCLSPEKFEKSKYFKRLVFKKWIHSYAGTTSLIIKKSFYNYNGLLKEHLYETERLRMKGKDLPNFLTGYELDFKYKPIQDYLKQVEQKAEKLIVPETSYYDRSIGKRLFVCQLKVKRLERELNKFKLNHK